MLEHLGGLCCTIDALCIEIPCLRPRIEVVAVHKGGGGAYLSLFGIATRPCDSHKTMTYRRDLRALGIGRTDWRCFVNVWCSCGPLSLKIVTRRVNNLTLTIMSRQHFWEALPGMLALERANSYATLILGPAWNDNGTDALRQALAATSQERLSIKLVGSVQLPGEAIEIIKSSLEERGDACSYYHEGLGIYLALGRRWRNGGRASKLIIPVDRVGELGEVTQYLGFLKTLLLLPPTDSLAIANDRRRRVLGENIVSILQHTASLTTLRLSADLQEALQRIIEFASMQALLKKLTITPLTLRIDPTQMLSLTNILAAGLEHWDGLEEVTVPIQILSPSILASLSRLEGLRRLEVTPSQRNPAWPIPLLARLLHNMVVYHHPGHFEALKELELHLGSFHGVQQPSSALLVPFFPSNATIS